jgi:hypothetical protein
MDLFSQAHALHPAMTEASNNLALIKAHLVHDDVAAEELFKGALEAEPNNVGHMVSLHSNQALLVCSNGQLRRADDLLQRALALDPGHSGATQNLRFVRRLIDKQRAHQLSQRHRIHYPTAQYNRAHHSNTAAHQHTNTAQPSGGASAGRAPAGWGGGGGMGTLGPGAGEAAGKGGVGEEGGGPGWAPADERSFETNDETRRFETDPPPVASLNPSLNPSLNVLPTQRLPVLKPMVLKASDAPGHMWSVKEELAVAEADRERKEKKRMRLEEEEEAREEGRGKARPSVDV